MAAGKKDGEVKQMSTLINWLEAGRRLAERLDHLIWSRAQPELAPAR
jgi:hypothetical protein